MVNDRIHWSARVHLDTKAMTEGHFLAKSYVLIVVGSEVGFTALVTSLFPQLETLKPTMQTYTKICKYCTRMVTYLPERKELGSCRYLYANIYQTLQMHPAFPVDYPPHRGEQNASFRLWNSRKSWR